LVSRGALPGVRVDAELGVLAGAGIAVGASVVVRVDVGAASRMMHPTISDATISV